MSKPEGDTDVSHMNCISKNINVGLPDGAVQLPDKSEESVFVEPASSHGVEPLMDLDRGIVGWDSLDDPANPK